MVVVTRVAKVPPSSRYDTGLVTLRRSTVVVSLLSATILTGWSAGATWILLSKDSFASHMVKRETARQYVYEDRIASLKNEIDKLSSKQLVDQDGVEAKVAELVTRQSQLETRHAIVAALADSVNSQQITSGRPARAPRVAISPQPPVQADATSSISSFAPSPRPVPVPDMPGFRRDGGRENGRDGDRKGHASAGWDQSAIPAGPQLENSLGLVDKRLSSVSVAQLRALNSLETTVSGAHVALRNVVADVGLDPDRLATAPGISGQGGPFIPVRLDPKIGPFEAAVVRLQPRIQAVERLRTVVTALPLHRPMGVDAEQTSSFGHRLDPFTRSLAMHAGIDFRAEHGTPVRASGAGRVVTAEYSGGYGNMVEIDHGHALTTRFAHLSQINVSEGQHIAAGSIIGRVGSTGRSTGPHLHYETRIDGDAVDPQRFLRAGQRFLAQN